MFTDYFSVFMTMTGTEKELKKSLEERFETQNGLIKETVDEVCKINLKEELMKEIDEKLDKINSENQMYQKQISELKLANIKMQNEASVGNVNCFSFIKLLMIFLQVIFGHTLTVLLETVFCHGLNQYPEML